MFTAIIENEGNTLVMEFPCKRYLMADHLGSIGIRKPAHEIKCMDEEEEPIKVKIVGNNEFEKRLALLISPTDTLSLVNLIVRIINTFGSLIILGFFKTGPAGIDRNKSFQ